MTSPETVAVSERRCVAIEVPYATQMLVAWPDLVDRAERVAQSHGAPSGATWRVVNVATPQQSGLMIWEWTEDG